MSSFLVREHHERAFGSETAAGGEEPSETAAESARGSFADRKSKGDDKRSRRREAAAGGTAGGARERSAGTRTAKRSVHQRHSALSGFERIRTVGKGTAHQTNYSSTLDLCVRPSL